MKINIAISILGFFIGWVIYNVFKDIVSQKDKTELKQDSLITEHQRLQREIEWQTDSIQAIINRQLDTLIYKANKYDSIERSKGRGH